MSFSSHRELPEDYVQSKATFEFPDYSVECTVGDPKKGCDDEGVFRWEGL